MDDTELNQLLIENRKMRKALEKIAKWHGEFPDAETHDGIACSYESAYGSNGARDYMRQIALNAIDAA